MLSNICFLSLGVACCAVMWYRVLLGIFLCVIHVVEKYSSMDSMYISSCRCYINI